MLLRILESAHQIVGLLFGRDAKPRVVGVFGTGVGVPPELQDSNLFMM